MASRGSGAQRAGASTAAPLTVVSASTGTTEVTSKQDLLNDLCEALGLPREPIGVGSSPPSRVFEAAARAAGVRVGSMPEIGEAIAARAGLDWGPDCDSRGSVSGGGSTVTREGLAAMVKAVRLLS